MTFFEYRMACKKVTLHEELEWQRVGLIASILVNQNLKKGTRPLTSDDFNPYAAKHQGTSEEETRRVVSEAKELAESLIKRQQNNGKRNDEGTVVKD